MSSTADCPEIAPTVIRPSPELLPEKFSVPAVTVAARIGIVACKD